MFIAHLPAGYLLSRLLPTLPVSAILIGSVLPDADMLRFYILDEGSVHHHTYLTHRPAFWAAIALLAIRAPWLYALCIGALLHLMLDTVVGTVDWGWPIAKLSGPLVVVPALGGHWVLSFLVHWTFALEIAICISAATAWLWTKEKPRRKGRGSSV